MGIAIAFVAVALILAGFLALTSFEAKRGRRFFASLRDRLDVRVAHASEVLSALDLGKLIYHAVHAAFEHVVHEIAHMVLIVVRLLERFLTRAVRYLRDRRADIEANPRTPLTEEVEKLKEVIRGPEKGEGVVE